MAHENCPELTENEYMKKAADIHLKYMCELNALVTDFTHSQCKELIRICNSAKTNNCVADMYYVSKDLRDSLDNIAQWHKFNRTFHDIDLT